MNSVPNSSEAAFSRRKFLGTAFAGTAATLAGGASVSFFAAEPAVAQNNLTPDEALKALVDGNNERYVSGRLSSFDEDLKILRDHTVDKQEPFAAVRSCADSQRTVPHKNRRDCGNSTQSMGIPVNEFRASLLLIALLTTLSSYANAQGLPPLAGQTVGNEFRYTVKAGDTLVSIGARNGIESGTLAAMNGLKAKTALKPGQVLDIDNRHIVPADLPDGILVNLPQRKLFLLDNGKVQGNYPIGPGKAVFATPIGSFSVIQMRENPTWYVPKSIQDEWAKAGKVVKKTVPPGPNNPLGGYWIGLSFPSYGIHGTNAPLSIYDFQSRGCIRMHPDDAGALFRQVEVGQRGEIIYEPVLLAQLQNGEILLEVHRDPYRKKSDAPLQFVRRLAGANDLAERIDWAKATEVASRAEGVAREIDTSAH